MRLVVVGCEYVGKTTLIDALFAWGEARGIHYHLDDHFSIPDQFFLDAAEQAAMLAMPPTIKERFQRFQIYYHVANVIQHHPDCLLGGFHIEEAIYGPRYYYPGKAFPSYDRRIEAELPPDTILLLLTASAAVIRQRMATTPHQYPIVASAAVEEISAEFLRHYQASWVERKFTIDTSNLTGAQLLATFLERVVPHLSERDLLRWQLLGGRA